jgi:acyl-CoA thioester hydrolase
MEHSCKLRVRSYECDSYGHVNNAVYLNYLEFARHQYLKDIDLSLEDLRAGGFAMWVVEIQIRYRKPAKSDDELTIVTRPLKKLRLSGILNQRVLRGNTEIAEAEVKWACVDAHGRPVPLPVRFHREGLDP